MIVEFAGIPGSGKSSAASRLLSTAAECGVDAALLPLSPITSKMRLTAQRAGWLARHPRMLTAVVRGLAQRKAPASSNWFAFRHTTVTAHALWQARSVEPSNRLVIAPEGILQRAFMLFVDRSGVTNARLVQRFLMSSPLPDVVVLLRTEPAVALTRVRHRDDGPLSQRFNGMSDRDIEKVLAAGQTLLFDATQRLCSDVGDVTRMEVIDTDDLAAGLDTLTCVYIDDLMRNRLGDLS